MTETPSARHDSSEAGGQVLTTGAGVLRGALWKLVSTTMPQAYALVTSIVAARVLGADGTGRQSFIAYVELTLITLLAGGIPNSLMRFVGELSGARQLAAAAFLVGWARRLALAAGLLGAGALVAVALAGATPQAAWLLAAVVCFTSILQTIPGALLVGLQRWRQAVIAGLVVGAGGTASTIVVLLLGGGITGMFAVEAVSSMVTLAWTSRLARHAGGMLGPRAERPSPELIRSVLRYAAGATLTSIVFLIVWTRSEFFILAHFSTEAEIAFYSIGFAVVNAVIRLPVAAVTVLTPAFANLFGAGDHERIRAGFERALRLLVVFTFPLVALTLALGPTAVEVIWGSDFSRAGDVLLILTASSIMVPFTFLNGSLLAGLGRIRMPVLGDISAACVDIGLAFALIPAHGALGAATANAGAQVTIGVLSAVFAWRTLGGFHVAARVAVAMFVAAAVGGAAAWSAQALLAPVPGLACGAVLGTAVTLGAAALLGVITAEDALWFEELSGGTRKYAGALVRRLARLPGPVQTR